MCVVGRAPRAVRVKHEHVERVFSGLELMTLARAYSPCLACVENHRRPRFMVRAAATASHHPDTIARMMMFGL